MKQTLFFLLSLLLIQDNFSQEPSSCSCLSLKSNDTIIMGRNHDANLGNCLIVYNPSNIYKEGFEFPEENTPQWKSKYASITFNVLGVGFAVCGMNEAGLSMGHTGFDEAQYPSKDSRPVLDQIQYITYLLDNCATTSEVIKTANEIRISDESMTREHYFICDKTGEVAIIEFIKGELVLYTNETMPYHLFSNDSYQKSLAYLDNYMGFGGQKSIPDKNFGVEEIMAIGCNRINEFYKKDNDNIIESAFAILNDIGFNKYPPPDTLDISKNFGTQFTVVFDLKNLKVFFQTKSNPKIREVDMNDFSPACSDSMRMLEAEQTEQGNVNKLFQSYSYEANRKFLYDRLKNAKGISQEVIEFLAQYPETYRCE